MDTPKTPIEGSAFLPVGEPDGDEEHNMSAVESELDDEAENDDDETDDDDESHASSEEDPEVAKPIQTKIFEAIEKIKTKTYKLGNRDQRKQFFDTYGEAMKNRTEDDDLTFLHVLLNTRDIPVKTLESPVKHIVQKYPRLLLEADREKKTPLYIAIESSKMSRLAEIMIDGCKYFDRALAKPCREKGENCLHLAMRSRHLPGAVKQKFIRLAPKEAIYAQDSKGYTPLHYAVEFKRANEEQLEVVKQLIAKDDTAFLKVTKAPDPRSVYQYAEHTRLTYDVPKASTRTPASSRSKDKNADSRTPGEQDASRDQPEPQAPAAPKRELDPKSKREAERKAREEIEARQKKEASSRHGQGRNENPDVKSREPVGPPPVDGSRKGDAVDPLIRSLTRKATVTFDETAKEKSSRKSRKTVEDPKEAEETKKKLEEWSAKIRLELKLHCMRTRAPDETTRFLYGKNKAGTQICFEYFGAPAAIKSRDFKASFEHLRFDEVLQYVAFPRLEVEPKPALHPRTNAADEDYPLENLGRGRTDMIYFFDWLRKKNVKRIIRVIVQEVDGQPSHSDEAIERALAGFQVEALDWQKPDLDPDTICAVSEELRELTLHWRGNNAVLKGWSDNDGLRRLRHLEKVHMHIHRLPAGYDEKAEVNPMTQDLETVDRSLLYFQRFCKRLNEDCVPAAREAPLPTDEARLSISIPNGNGIGDDASEVSRDDQGEKIETLAFARRKPVQVISHNNDIRADTSLGATPSASQAEAKAQATSHRWLDTTDNFADMIQNVWMTAMRKGRGGPTRDQPLLKHVVVALIDDGVDMHDQSLQGKILDGQTFDHGDDFRVRPYWVSEKGHGTVMANMICRVCPMVKIVAIRLDTRASSTPGKTSIVVRSAAEAIEAAVEKDAHIISMSWTVAPPTDTEDKEKFDEAIRIAAKQKILMFCSSSDGGHYSDTDYPSASARDSLFRIGAAQDDGLPYSWAGPVDKLDYIFPGVEVVQRSSRPAPGTLAKWKPETGSSIATALAAGLAALVVYCVKIGALHTQSNPGAKTTGVTAADVDLIKMHKNMKQAFDGIGASRETQHKFIEVWRLFESAVGELRSGDHDSRMAVIANLARNLVRRS
ncbi:hypothetical protein ACHAP9_008779 [Verticillium nonalfalfae]